MKHLKIYEAYSGDYPWIKEWINTVFGSYTISSSIKILPECYEITIFYDGDTWNGIIPSKLEKIIKFTHYLLDKEIIKSEEQIKFQAHGQFIIVLKIIKEDFQNNPELETYKNVKKYNL